MNFPKNGWRGQCHLVLHHVKSGPQIPKIGCNNAEVIPDLGLGLKLWRSDWRGENFVSWCRHLLWSQMAWDQLPQQCVPPGKLPNLVFHCCSVAKSCLTLCDPTDCSTPGFTIPEFAQTMSIDLVMPSNISSSATAFSSCLNLSQHQVFSSELGLCIRWPKYWSFKVSISPFHEYSGLISFRVDWFGLLAVQETLKDLLQHQNSKTSILKPSAFCRSSLVAQLVESAGNEGDPVSVPQVGRVPGEGNGSPLYYSCLENSMDSGAWWAAVHGVTKSRTQLSG